MAAPKTQGNVHWLMVSPMAFEIITTALKTTSIRNRRLEKLHGMIADYLDRGAPFSPCDVKAFSELHPFEGDIRIHIRLNAGTDEKLRELKQQLSNLTQLPVGVRDAVVFCCCAITHEHV